jgi:hypothetical protein
MMGTESSLVQRKEREPHAKDSCEDEVVVLTFLYSIVGPLPPHWNSHYPHPKDSCEDHGCSNAEASVQRWNTGK